jgi:hypothetical protein
MKRLLAALIAAIALTIIPAVPGVAKSKPRNDGFSRAKKISTLPYDKTVDVTSATQASDDPKCRDTGHTVWFKFTPETDMRLIARVSGKKVVEWVSVWTGERGALAEVVCGDYRPLFEASAGTTYYFMVGTYRNRRGGDIRFRLSEAPPPPTIDFTVDPEVIVNPQTEQVTVSGTIACTNSEYMEFYGSVRQVDDDRRFISAFFYGYDEECDETPQPWTATELGDGVFIDGPGLLEFEAYSCSRIECVEFENVFNVTVKRAAT